MTWIATGVLSMRSLAAADLGEFEEAVILKTFGDVPEDFDCARS
jgi:hypothetical protein